MEAKGVFKRKVKDVVPLSAQDIDHTAVKIAELRQAKRDRVNQLIHWNPQEPHRLHSIYESGQTIVPNNGAPPLTGRAWDTETLATKSFADLHQIWYALVMERNRLLTKAHYGSKYRIKSFVALWDVRGGINAYDTHQLEGYVPQQDDCAGTGRDEREMFGVSQLGIAGGDLGIRFRKIKESMRNVKQVLFDRQSAYQSALLMHYRKYHGADEDELLDIQVPQDVLMLGLNAEGGYNPEATFLRRPPRTLKNHIVNYTVEQAVDADAADDNRELEPKIKRIQLKQFAFKKASANQQPISFEDDSIGWKVTAAHFDDDQYTAEQQSLPERESLSHALETDSQCKIIERVKETESEREIARFERDQRDVDRFMQIIHNGKYLPKRGMEIQQRIRNPVLRAQAKQLVRTQHYHEGQAVKVKALHAHYSPTERRRVAAGEQLESRDGSVIDMRPLVDRRYKSRRRISKYRVSRGTV